MEWSPQQSDALRAISKWANAKGGQQVFRLFGFAGTGKTTLAKQIAADFKRGRVMFASFTGKAAQVLRNKGCTDARTIHSLIYVVDEEKEDGKVSFILNKNSDLFYTDLLIVDEVSMVNDEIGRDLLKFGTKILVLGDPGQLPPIEGTGFFTSSAPDIMLTEIHRQAADNPIIRMSTDVREGRGLVAGNYGTSKVITRIRLDQGEVIAADQVLVGMNRTRVAFNRRIRELLGHKDMMPIPGDRLICLRNSHDLGLLNGGMWRCLTSVDESSVMNMSVLSDDDGSLRSVEVPNSFFVGTEKDLPWWFRKKHQEFTYGYTVTVHKAQGSEWQNVMLFDESHAFRETRIKHLYTAITRAADRITVVI